MRWLPCQRHAGWVGYGTLLRIYTWVSGIKQLQRDSTTDQLATERIQALQPSVSITTLILHTNPHEYLELDLSGGKCASIQTITISQSQILKFSKERTKQTKLLAQSISTIQWVTLGKQILACMVV